MKKIIACLFSTWISISALAQIDCKVRGMITACTNKDPLIGAVVMAESATPSGVITDVDGKFELNIPVDAKAIVVKYIGYKEKRIVIDKKQPCNIELELCLEEYNIGPMPWPPYIPPVIVEGFRNKRPIESTPASIGLVGKTLLNSTDQTSLQNAVNMIPGVQMEQRGYGGSHRINIRGSSMRAPFAVRNVKMYVDGIPLTSPDGQTPLEMMDAFDIGALEIIKGPSGSVYGSGNGGVLLFTSSKAAFHESIFRTSAQVGSYDLYRTASDVSVGLGKGFIRASHVYQDNKGYRVQEFNHKNQFTVNGQYFLNEKNSLTFYSTYLNANWGLPGGLSAMEADTLPTQANAYSWRNNAHVWRERVMAGASHTHRFGLSSNPVTTVTTALYFYDTSKLNPFGTSAFNNGYKEEGASGAGGRMDWTHQTKMGNWVGKLNWGGEYQWEHYTITESSILSGQADAFKYNYDVNYNSGMAYTSLDADYRNRLFINAGVSLNNTHQNVMGSNATDFAFDTTANWKSQILPRIALSYRFYKHLHAYASYSHGNSNPTVFEMVDYENNAYNLGLRPERGVNIEAGLKLRDYEQTLFAELNIYSFTLDNFILQRTINIPVADTLIEIEKYQNSGSTTQNGIEWSVRKKWNVKSIRGDVEVLAAGSGFFYWFDEYQNDDGEYRGKRLPGVPLFNTSSGVRVKFLNRFRTELMHFWTDRAPLNNSNAAWSSSYHLLNFRMSYQLELRKKWELNVYAGINNLLNKEYTSYLQPNAVNGRYYNPSPPLNYFGGFSLKWIFGSALVKAK